jgi:hypothetical protein
MRLLLTACVALAVLCSCALSSSAGVLFSDEFTSFVKTPGGSYYYGPFGKYPDTCEPVTVDGRTALHMYYAAGLNKGLTLIPTPHPVSDYYNLSVVFKPVGDAYVTFYVRLYSYNHDIPDWTLWLDSLFWGSQPNGNVFDVQDWHNSNAYWGPFGDNRLWHAGAEPENWYTYTINICKRSSVAHLYDINGNEL